MRDVMLDPVCRAMYMLPRHITLSDAIPSRADSHSASPHIRDASRTRVPDVTRCGWSTNALFATCEDGKRAGKKLDTMTTDCASCTLWIVQHDVHPELFVLSRVRRACVWCACLRWVLAGLACSGARAGFLADFLSLPKTKLKTQN